MHSVGRRSIRKEMSHVKAWRLVEPKYGEGSRVIHDWDDEKAVAILKVVRGAVPAKGRLLLFETMIRADSRLSYPLLSDLNMVIRTGGCERTEAEYRALYKAADSKLTRASKLRPRRG